MSELVRCPECGDPLSVHGVCGSCGYGLKRRRGSNKDNAEAAHWGELAAKAKELYQATAPTSFDLEPQQWYNVCKYFPWVAQHCKRERFEVGPDHPLDATSHLGPLTRHLTVPAPRRGDDPDAIDERAAIQADHA